ncbi:hypothetical protein B0H67DRAFT_40735 [Lasiosphaeris hirsuta]|uniref:Uncharacterized protein n=1 Tax=Lasiosphaeris hirsuta TaxID=260670 RepID=A0AA40BAT1_9PEZI|nr:hypothetical protein B0H67DRAFT_40735 [Lasiosphaeris hirsuta]
MSIGLDAVSDKEIDDSVQTTETASSTLVDSYANSSRSGNDGPATESLNPWSIAAMSTASRRQTSPYALVPRIPETHTPRPLQRRSVSQTSVLDSESDRPSGKYTSVEQARLGRIMLPPQRQLDFMAKQSPYNLQVGVHDGEHRKPAPVVGNLFRATAKTGRQQRGLELRGPSQSSHDIGYGRRLASRHQPRLYSPDSDGLVQSKISFGNGKSQQDRGKTHLKHCHHSDSGEIYTSFSVPRGTSGMNTKLPQAHKRPTSQEKSLQRHGVHDLAYRDPIGSDEVEAMMIEKQEEEHSRTFLSTEDSRAYLIKRQRSIAKHPQRKFRRLRMNMLPLETIFTGSETTTLVLVVHIESRSIHEQIERAARFDTYLIDGELGSGLQNGVNFELEGKVMALLSSIGYGGAKINLQPSSSVKV